MKHRPEEQPVRRKLAGKDWFVALAVFAIGLVIGTVAMGGITLAQAERIACNVALRYGVKLEPRFAQQPTMPAPDSTLHTAAASLESLGVEDIDHLREKLRDLEQQAVTASSTSSGGRKRTIVVVPPPPPSAQARATLAYWNRLNSAIEQEEQRRFAPSQLSESNALQFVHSRADNAAIAAQTIRELNSQEVDEAVTTLAQDIALWYDNSVHLNREAADLLERGTREARQGARGSTWKNGEEAHQKYCDELNRRGEAVRQQMTEKFNLAFPPLK